MSKLGPHCQLVTAQGLEWARRAPIVAAIDDTRPFEVAPPGAIRLFRHYFPEQRLDADPRWVTDQILAALKGYRHVNLYCQVYVGVAGPAVGAYLPLLRAVNQRLHAAGVYTAGPSWYTGDYEAEHVQAMRDAGWADCDLWCLQAYWATRGFTPWNALRYRQFWRPGDPRVVIGECGRDRVRDGEGGEYVGSPGWRSQGISAEEYVSELVAFDRELQRDPYVAGGVVFTSGPLPEWRDFDTDGLDLSGLWAGPVAPAPNDEEDSEAMSLREQYPAAFAEWEKAGGVENNFRAHLLGIGAIKPTKEDVAILTGQVKSATEQLANVVAALPFA